MRSWLVAMVFATGLCAGCGWGQADLTCEEYYALGNSTDPVPDQIAVLRDHVSISGDEATELSLAHMDTIAWCRERDEDNELAHAEDKVSTFLDDWND